MAFKVLLVDDEPNILLSLEFLMRKEGYEVALARDGEEAIQQVEVFAPDLILLDVMMPCKSGYEVCEWIRARPEGAAVRIIMLTAKGRESEVAKGLAIGADQYMSKPFSTKELMHVVRTLLAP